MAEGNNASMLFLNLSFCPSLSLSPRLSAFSLVLSILFLFQLFREKDQKQAEGRVFGLVKLWL